MSRFAAINALFAYSYGVPKIVERSGTLPHLAFHPRHGSRSGTAPFLVKWSKMSGMRSIGGFWASICFLTMIPVALVVDTVFGGGADASVHFSLAAGSGLLAYSAFGFTTPRWVAAAGCVVAISLSIIFLLQAIVALFPNPTLSYIALDLLGQIPERMLTDLLLLWLACVLAFDSEGRSRLLGMVVLGAASTVEAYAYWLNYKGTSLDAKFAILKVVMLTPFIWLLVESVKPRSPVQQASL